MRVLFRIILEILAELGAHNLESWVPLIPERFQEVGYLLFAAAVGYLIIHAYAERKHELSEYVLAEKVWEFMERRNALTNRTEVVKHALRDFSTVFSRFKIAHVSIFRVHGDVMKIDPNEVYPPERDKSYYISLGVKEGVAGRVYADMNPRYVPRLFLPMNSPGWAGFPHAFKLEIARSPDGGLQMVNPHMDLYVFRMPDGPLRFRSFLSVPLRVLPPHDGQGECVGVLNFDFDRTDPLDRASIQAAAFLGRVLAEELVRLQNFELSETLTSP